MKSEYRFFFFFFSLKEACAQNSSHFYGHLDTYNVDEKGNITIWSKGLFFPSTEPLQIYFSSAREKHCSPLELINITKLIYFWVKLSALYIEATHGLL